MKTTTRDLLREVRRLSAAAHDAKAELFAASGLGAPERRLLDALAAADGPRTVRQLARSMLCASSTIEPSLRALHADALIGEFPADLPSTHAYVLTVAGRAARCALQQAELRLEEVVDASLDGDEVARAIDVLRRARRRLEVVRHGPRLRLRVDGVSARVATCSSEALSATASAA
ncbi:MAG TPA: hypothetical protein VFP48_06830 [Steroidobacteraceae bacterium]|nr:hypothetical protein [Steroidobacteraceae bacterium]